MNNGLNQSNLKFFDVIDMLMKEEALVQIKDLVNWDGRDNWDQCPFDIKMKEEALVTD